MGLGRRTGWGQVEGRKKRDWLISWECFPYFPRFLSSSYLTLTLPPGHHHSQPLNHHYGHWHHCRCLLSTWEIRHLVLLIFAVCSRHDWCLRISFLSSLSSPCVARWSHVIVPANEIQVELRLVTSMPRHPSNSRQHWRSCILEGTALHRQVSQPASLNFTIQGRDPPVPEPGWVCHVGQK